MKKTGSKTKLDVVIPLCRRVLFRRDEAKKTTKGGIHLPDDAQIGMITGRILEIAQDVENDEDIPIRQYDKVLINPHRAIPVDIEEASRADGTELYIVPIEDVLAVFRLSTNDEDEDN